MSRRGLFWALLALSPLGAEEEAPNPARGTYTTTAAVTDPGAVDLELGYARIRSREGSRLEGMPTQLFLGLVEGLDLRVYWTGPNRFTSAEGETRSAVAEPWIGGQWRFLSQDRFGVEVALGGFHKVPHAEAKEGIASGHAEDQLLLALSRSSGPWLVDLNLIQNWVTRGEGPGRVRVPSASLCVTRLLGKGWNFSLDLYVLGGSELAQVNSSLLGALNWRVRPDLVLDFGVDAGLNQATPHSTLFVGLAWSVGRLWGGQ